MMQTQQAALDAEIMPALSALKMDMTRSTFIARKGDLLCVLTDVDLGAREKQTALLLAHRNAPATRKAYILFNQLWLLVSPDVPDNPQATRHNRAQQKRAITSLCERLYGFVTSDDINRVIDAVYECYTDLQNALPPSWVSKRDWMDALAADDMGIMFNGVAVNR